MSDRTLGLHVRARSGPGNPIPALAALARLDADKIFGDRSLVTAGAKPVRRTPNTSSNCPAASGLTWPS